MGVGDEAGRAAQGPVAVARDHERLLRADAVDRLAELEEAVPLDEVAVGARVALRDEIVGRSAGHQEDERRADPVLVAQLEEVGQLERLDEDRRVPPVEVVPAHGVGDLSLEVEAGLVEECRVLRLRVDADVSPQLLAQPLAQLEDLVERGHLEPVVPHGALLPDLRQSLLGTQRLQLGQGEVGREPPGHGATVDGFGGPPGGELGTLGDISRLGDLGLVASDEDAILGRDQVRLDEVGPHACCELVRGQGVLGTVAGRAAVRDDERLDRLPLRLVRRRGGARRSGRADGQGGGGNGCDEGLRGEDWAESLHGPNSPGAAQRPRGGSPAGW